MKKKTIKIISIITLVLFMTGCVKYNANIKITNDKKMDMELIIAVKKTLQEDKSTEDTDNDSINKLKKEGWKVEPYEDDVYKGSKLTKSYKNIDDISTTSKTNYDLNSLMQNGEEKKYMFYKKKENGKTIYVATFKANTDTAETNEETTEEANMTEEEKQQYEEMSKELIKSMDLKMTVEVPKVISSNATKTDGNKLTWDLTEMEDNQDIEFEFEIEEKGNILSEKNSSIPIIPIAVGCGLILVVIITGLSKKKKTINNEQITSQPTTTETPEQPQVTEQPIVEQSQTITPEVNVQPQPIEQPQVDTIPPVETQQTAPETPPAEPKIISETTIEDSQDNNEII